MTINRKKATADGHKRCPCGHACKSHRTLVSREDGLFGDVITYTPFAGTCRYCHGECPGYGMQPRQFKVVA